MSQKVRVRATAEQDIWSAVGWYDAHGQGERLLDEVAAAMTRISDKPELYQTVHGPLTAQRRSSPCTSNSPRRELEDIEY